MFYKKMTLFIQSRDTMALFLLTIGLISPNCQGYVNKEQNEETNTYILTVKRPQREEPYIYRPRFSGNPTKKSLNKDALSRNGNKIYDELKASANKEILSRPILVVLEDSESDKKIEKSVKRQVPMWGRRHRYQIYNPSTDIKGKEEKIQSVIDYPKRMKMLQPNRRFFFGEFDNKGSAMKKDIRFYDFNDDESMMSLNGNRDSKYKMVGRSIHPKFEGMKRALSTKDTLEDEKQYDESFNRENLQNDVKILQEEQDFNGNSDDIYISEENLRNLDDLYRSTRVLDNKEVYDNKRNADEEDLRNEKLKSSSDEKEIKLFIIKKAK